MPTAITDGATAPGSRAPVIMRTPSALRGYSDRCHAAGISLGLVPTMGALHAGHRALIQRARTECDRVIVSIFVNPTQFAPGEDFDRYPRPFEKDLAVCAEAEVDIVYAPEVEVMYPSGFVTTIELEGAVGETLEASHRPGHYRGVATVVTKLLAGAKPDRAYFGHKDAQQCAVVKRLAADLDTGTEIVVCPTVRDPDGLALSSRNLYLDAPARRQALAIPAALAAARRAYAAGERDAGRLQEIMRERLARSPDLALDYVAIVDSDSFEPVETLRVRCEILIAARIGGTRLIDVLTPGVDDPPDVDGEVDPSGETGTERSDACIASLSSPRFTVR